MGTIEFSQSSPFEAIFDFDGGIGGSWERSRAKKLANKGGNEATLGFEQTLWATADKLRNNLDSAEYNDVVLGLNK